jgi:hypothetical protein
MSSDNSKLLHLLLKVYKVTFTTEGKAASTYNSRPFKRPVTSLVSPGPPHCGGIFTIFISCYFLDLCKQQRNSSINISDSLKFSEKDGPGGGSTMQNALSYLILTSASWVCVSFTQFIHKISKARVG